MLIAKFPEHKFGVWGGAVSPSLMGDGGGALENCEFFSISNPRKSYFGSLKLSVQRPFFTPN